MENLKWYECKKRMFKNILYLTANQLYKDVIILSYDEKIIMFSILPTLMQWTNFEACFKSIIP
jgi:hypothetical protein